MDGRIYRIWILPSPETAFASRVIVRVDVSFLCKDSFSVSGRFGDDDFSVGAAGFDLKQDKFRHEGACKVCLREDLSM